MILKVENQPAIDPATALLVESELRSLSQPKRKFAILKDSPRFIQAMINDDETFVVEYSDGAPDQMFECEPVSLAEVTRAFLSFLDGGDYRGVLPFQRKS